MNESGTISVHFERKVSDGDYGNESASCSVTADFGEEALNDGYAHELARQMRELARDNVQAQLSRSPEQNVRRAAETLEARAQRYKREEAERRYRTAVYEDRTTQAQLAAARQALGQAEQRVEALAGDAQAVRAWEARAADADRVERLAREARSRVLEAEAELRAIGATDAELADVAGDAGADVPF